MEYDLFGKPAPTFPDHARQFIFPLADFREHLPGPGRRRDRQTGDFSMKVGAQERILRLLGADRRRDAALPVHKEPCLTSSARGQRFVVGLMVLAKRILASGYSAPKQLRVVRQAAQLEQRLPHHFRRALDDAAAADREQQGVAHKDELIRREEVGEVTGGVAGRVDDAAGERADLHGIALADFFIDMRDRLLSLRGATTNICAWP